ncbi:hypothetical protein BK005_01950 [bacterium CG10_37_50]|uniref:Uncharacterized protein n=1 Tax=Candidatus Campbellbacteria bacterium CG22_combo_CG10-13_8_21_14_all_36_13 TaxID=1974529 RepID=A0A2H0DZ62_9BACT|nr:MAG: hypothetical protein BK005_01950 [bacterium CG10_37_50]PIP87466.1 MAG: hypothetical protein COW81_00115 [Candidatus Campbellbacteria bacterium CG22_combo_CG10-13_8_21_14_all_36_13]
MDAKPSDFNNLHDWQEYMREMEEKYFGITPNYDPDKRPEPRPELWKEIDDAEFPANRWLVNGLFPKEGLSIVASISGEGKSILLMHLAKCISEGTAWFDNPELSVEKGRVLYINLEMSRSEIQRRGRKM